MELKANSSDGRIEDLPGVDMEAGYKQKIVQWCFDGASPLTVEVSDPLTRTIVSADGKTLRDIYSCTDEQGKPCQNIMVYERQ